jgi:vacuolar-type H+-ATPase subunit I/STV1
MNEVQRRILAAQQARKEAKAKVHKSTKELTSLKFNQTEKRIAEIDLKIERLTKEKENLLRKQNNRKEFLSR